MSDLLITHVDVLTDEGVLKNHAIEINNGYITAILNDIEAEKVKDSAKEVLDGKGQLATPGLVNTHTHIAMGLFRNYADDLELMEWLETAIWPTEAKLNDDYVRYGTQLGIAEMLRTGTTTFSDMYFFMNTTAEVVKETGIRSVLSRGLAGVSPTADQALVENADLFRTWNGFDNDRIKVLLGPHAPYTCPDDYMEKVIALSHELNCGIHFWNTTLAAHCVHVTDEDMAIMAGNNVAVAHNPQSNLKLASGIAPVPEMIAKGITVGLGTDGSASNNNADMLEEVRLAATLHKARLYDPKAIPAQAAWNMGTVEGAKALGYIDLGVLAKGYRADIVLYDVSGMHWMPRYNDLAALVYSANSSDVNTTIVGGKVLMKDKELLTIDEEKLRAEITKAQAYFSN
ncbi:MAG: amidohydrolase [Veillonella parvula]|nr:amidohydrolase [Veillonella parvula]